MADPAEQLADYVTQLEHVEAAILAEPDNEELLKLKEDLLEVIGLTKELMEETVEEEPPKEKPAPKKFIPAVFPSVPQLEKPVRDWKAGDRCLAVWSQTGKYYEAVVEDVDDEEAVVCFVGFETKEKNSLLTLRKINDQEVAKNIGKQSKIKLFNEQREKRRDKALKRVQKQKQLEQAKEMEKTRWHDFAKKASARSYKGMKRPPVVAPQSQAKAGTSARHVAGTLPRY